MVAAWRPKTGRRHDRTSRYLLHSRKHSLRKVMRLSQANDRMSHKRSKSSACTIRGADELGFACLKADFSIMAISDDRIGEEWSKPDLELRAGFGCEIGKQHTNYVHRPSLWVPMRL